MAIFRGTSGNDTANAAIGVLSPGFQNGDDDTLALFLDSIGDFIVGFDGEDFIFAGPGNDIIEGGEGFDRLNGAEGNDTIYANIQIDRDGSLIGDEILGNIGDDILRGSSGGDMIDGGDGFDQLSGGPGADQLFGGEGIDFFNFSTGDVAAGEVIDGGSGSLDRLLINSDVDFTAAASIIGMESIRFFSPSTATMTAQQFKTSGISTVLFSYSESGPERLQIEMRGETALNLSTTSVTADTDDEIRVIGDASDEAIIGSTARDAVYGNGGNDALSGLAGDDVLIGGLGQDLIIGGRGRDFMTGNGGNDRFDFNVVADSGPTSATRDIITDFAAGTGLTTLDRIDVSTIDANTTLAGNQAFALGKAFLAGHFQATQSGASVLLEFNTDADTAFEMRILLSNVSVANLNSGDFIL